MSTIDLETLLKLIWSLGSAEAGDRGKDTPGSGGEGPADQGSEGVVGGVGGIAVQAAFPHVGS